MKVVIWEELIDKVHCGMSYFMKHLTVRIFDDEKFLNTNEMTAIEDTQQLADVNLNTDDIKEHMMTGVQIAKKDCCVVCNSTIEDLPSVDEDDIYTCTECNNTFLLPTNNSKIVCSLQVKTDDGKMSNFTCFNDAVRSFLSVINNDVESLLQIDPKDLAKLFLKAGKMTFIADKSSKIIDQFV